VRHILSDLEALDVPVIHFGTGTASLLELQRAAGGSVIGVDWRTPLDSAWERLGGGVAVQGNLDPLLLGAPRPLLTRRIDDVLRRAAGRPGHIFNVGHGILPDTPPDAVKFAVDWVHEHAAR
jgi:uroporphyrinogen decarboxylase